MFNSYNNAPEFVRKFVDTTIDHEGDEYTNIKEDSGGKTKYGVTEKAALAKKKFWHLYGWDGDVQTMPLQFAQDLYVDEYYLTPKFNLVAEVSQMISAEIFDSSVNIGTRMPSLWLQQLLNVLNNSEAYYKDITEDGVIGKETTSALMAYIDKRGRVGIDVLYNMLNICQGKYYIDLAVKREKDESFIYGWIRNRVTFK